MFRVRLLLFLHQLLFLLEQVVNHILELSAILIIGGEYPALRTCGKREQSPIFLHHTPLYVRVGALQDGPLDAVHFLANARIYSSLAQFGMSVDNLFL